MTETSPLSDWVTVKRSIIGAMRETNLYFFSNNSESGHVFKNEFFIVHVEELKEECLENRSAFSLIHEDYLENIKHVVRRQSTAENIMNDRILFRRQNNVVVLTWYS